MDLVIWRFTDPVIRSTPVQRVLENKLLPTSEAAIQYAQLRSHGFLVQPHTHTHTGIYLNTVQNRVKDPTKHSTTQWFALLVLSKELFLTSLLPKWLRKEAVWDYWPQYLVWPLGVGWGGGTVALALAVRYQGPNNEIHPCFKPPDKSSLLALLPPQMLISL